MVILLIVVVMAEINLVAEWVNRPREMSPPEPQNRIGVVPVEAPLTPAPPEVLTDAMHNWPQWRGPRWRDTWKVERLAKAIRHHRLGRPCLSSFR